MGKYQRLGIGEARFRFVERMQSIPYGNCHLFEVREAESQATVLPEHKQLHLAVHRSGIYFFLDPYGESLLRIDLDDVDQIYAINVGVALVPKRTTAHRTLWLKMEESVVFCDTVMNHKKIFGGATRTVRRSRGLTQSSDGFDSSSVPPYSWRDSWNMPHWSRSSERTPDSRSGMDDIYAAGPSRLPNQRDGGKSSKSSSYMGTSSQSGSQQTSELQSTTTSSGSRNAEGHSNWPPKSDKRNSSNRRGQKP